MAGFNYEFCTFAFVFCKRILMILFGFYDARGSWFWENFDELQYGDRIFQLPPFDFDFHLKHSKLFNVYRD